MENSDNIKEEICIPQKYIRLVPVMYKNGNKIFKYWQFGVVGNESNKVALANHLIQNTDGALGCDASKLVDDDDKLLKFKERKLRWISEDLSVVYSLFTNNTGNEHLSLYFNNVSSKIFNITSKQIVISTSLPKIFSHKFTQNRISLSMLQKANKILIGNLEFIPSHNKKQNQQTKNNVAERNF